MINVPDICESVLYHRLRLIIVPVLILSLHGCASLKNLQMEQWPFRGQVEEKIEKNDFKVARTEGVIGRLASVRLNKGDTLPDIARHFSLGINEVSSANPGVDVWVPGAGERIILPLSFVLPDAPRKGIVINLATLRLFQFKGDGKSLAVSTYPVGIGTAERPTPIGQTSVKRKQSRPTWYVPASISEDHRKKGDPLPPKVLPGPLNPLGEYAMYLNKSSYLIHGTNKPASIGLKATNGCIRLYPEDIKKLYAATPVNTPVSIVNQPYLVGQRDGVIYLEAHKPLEGSGTVEQARMYLKLREIEKQLGHQLDWAKIKEIIAESRGIPVRIFEVNQGTGTGAEKIVEVRHPEKLFGKPEVPELKSDAWYVLAADLREEANAERMAAIINHQGPPIPARVISKSNTYRVIAGPFNDGAGARDAAKRLKIDLEIEGILIEPARNK